MDKRLRSRGSRFSNPSGELQTETALGELPHKVTLSVATGRWDGVIETQPNKGKQASFTRASDE